MRPGIHTLLHSSMRHRRSARRPGGPGSGLLALLLPLAVLGGCASTTAEPSAQGVRPQARTAGAGPSIPVVANRSVSDARQEQNLNTVLSFYEAGLNQKDFASASRHFGPHYIQHNPMAEDGVEGFRKFIAYLKDTYPQSRSEIRTAFASGDYVILHVLSRRTPDATGSAIIDIFRLENGKIVEHWDVIQPIPDKAANTNTMF